VEKTLEKHGTETAMLECGFILVKAERFLTKFLLKYFERISYLVKRILLIEADFVGNCFIIKIASLGK